MDVKDFDYDLIKDNFEELLKVTKNNNITQIKPDQLARFNIIRKGVDTSKYIIIESMGDTDILLDTKTDSIKYLNLHDQSVTDVPKNDNLVKLSENEFYLAMKYKLTQKLDIEDSGVVDIINKEYYENYSEGKKVIIDDQIGSIQSTNLTSLKILLGDGNTITVDVNPDSPEDNVNLLDDVLLDEADIRELTINENKVRVIGKYINKSGNRMLVISSLDGSFMKILNYSEFRKTQKP